MKRIVLFALFFFIGSMPAHAATLYLSPATGTYKVGDSVTVTAYVESTSQAMNAVSGAIAIPTDVFDIVSVSSSGSVVNFWVQEPVRVGTQASFEGVVLNPGYIGSAGRIATITLRAKKAGSGSLAFTTASILANDGKGTNLLSGTRGATLSIGAGPAPAPAVAEEEKEEQVPTGPDTAGPTIRTFSEIARESKSDAYIRVRASATDPSGVASYEFSLDGGAYLAWDDFASGIYAFNAGPGAHTLTLRVADSYGNETRDYILIHVVPLQTPRILSYPQTMTLADTTAQVVGDAPTGTTQVTITLSPQFIAGNAVSRVFGQSISALPRTINGTVASDGTWNVSLASIDISGEYLMTVTGHDARGASSFPSSPVHISVKLSFIGSIIAFITAWPLLVLVILVLLGVLWWKRKHVSGAVGMRVGKIKKSLDSAFTTMERNIEKERTQLKKRDGADKEEEEEMLDALEENIQTTEKRIEDAVEELEESLDHTEKS